MQRYNKGDKVKTIDYWNNGFGNIIPKGSIVTVISDNGKAVFCEFKDFQALYEYEWLGEVVGNTIKTNVDRIRSMTDEELAEFLDNNVPDCARLCPDFKAGCSWTCKHNQGKDFLLKWLQSKAE